jgi:signal transduction histidine kinase
MDPITILLSAKAAFTGIQTAVKYGKDLQSMIGDVSKLMGAAGQLTKVATKSKNGFNITGSAEEMALKAFTARKQVEQMQQDVKNLITGEYGAGAWNEIVGEINQIKKEQKLAAKHQAESKAEQNKLNLIIGAGLIVLVAVCTLISTAISIR